MKRVDKTIGTLGLVALVAINIPFAVADDSGWYAGGNVGQSRAKIDDAKITSNLLGAGFTTTSIIDEDQDTGYKIFGGYQYNKYFALEGGYFDLGKFGFTSTTAAPSAGTLSGNIKLRGLNLDAVGTLPITDKFSAFGRVGVSYVEAKDNFTSTGLVPALADPNPSKNAANYKFGLGLQYALNESVAVRAEAERYRVDDAVGNKGDIDLYSVGLIYRFGGKTRAPAPRAPEPERIAAAEPQPAVVTPPPPPEPIPPPAPRKMTFSADSLFDFDKESLKPAGKEDLDKLAADLKGAEFNVIKVTGHSDRIGAHDYNMKLSARRAEAVKAYLVESAGIPADKISTNGIDGADPVTKPDECKGNVATRELITCLGPDRRVEVEVIALKPVQK